jgi:hypothetical protein
MAKKKPDQDTAAETPATDAKKKKSGAADKADPAAAAPVAAAPPPAPPRAPAKVKIPKLAKKNKSRLPRRQKKAQQKAANRQ